MRQLTYFFNVILTLAAIVLTLGKFLIKDFEDITIGYLVILGIYQLAISLGITIYSVITNYKVVALYLIYWLHVIAFFKFIMQDFFYACVLLAIYNLYIHYCSFSNSKYNILKLWK